MRARNKLREKSKGSRPDNWARAFLFERPCPLQQECAMSTKTLVPTYDLTLLVRRFTIRNFDRDLIADEHVAITYRHRTVENLDQIVELVTRIKDKKEDVTITIYLHKSQQFVFAGRLEDYDTQWRSQFAA
jgi:hypothetical protein